MTLTDEPTLPTVLADVCAEMPADVSGPPVPGPAGRLTRKRSQMPCWVAIGGDIGLLAF